MMIDREMKTTINNWILQGKEAFLLTGARQIGKTYLIRECLKESKYDYIALNFIERPELVELFENATNAQDLLMRLSLITDKQLNKGNTIIFFDEIQEFKDIVTRIKFLVEEGMDIKTFREKFLEILNQIPKEDEIILLCDIIGGSPFTSSAELLRQEGFLERSLILTGMNMPVLVQLLLQKDDSALEQLKSEVKAISAGTIQIFEEESEDEDEEL